MGSPIFTEVIDVTLNSGPLEASLTELVTMYQGELQKMSGSGIDLGGVSGIDVTGITSDLESVRTELKALTDAFMESFSTIAAQSATTGGAITTNITKALEEVDAAANIVSKSTLEKLAMSASGSTDAWAEFAAKASLALEQGFDPRVRMTAELTANLFTLIGSGGAEAFDKLSAQQLDWALKAKSMYADVEASRTMSGNNAAAQEQAALLKEQIALGNDIIIVTQRRRAEEEALGAATVAIINRTRAEQEALGADSLAIISRQRAEQMALGAATVAVINRERSEQMALAADITAINARQRAEQEALGAATVAVVSRERAEQMALGDDIMAILNRQRAEEVALGNDIIAIYRREAEAKQAASQGSSGGVASGFLNTQLDSLASLGKMFVEWEVIGDVMSGVQKIGEGIAGYFKDGAAYLADMEDKSAQLQGSLATNLTFSQDQAENYRLAGVAARQMNVEIQDAAIKYGVGVDILTRSFKSFVNTGGTTLTRGLDEALKTSNLLTVSILASGKSVDTTRSALAEIPKLLDGTISSTSKILETLGISAAEWKKMTAEARTQHNLLDQLQVRLKSFEKVAADSADRFTAVKTELGLMYDRVAALSAQQFWPDLKQDLKDIKQYFEDNRVKIVACAVAVGNLVDQLIKLNDPKQFFGRLLAGFQDLIVLAIELKYDIAAIVHGAQLLGGVAKLISTVGAVDNGGAGLKAHIKDVKDAAQQIKAMWHTNSQDAAKEAADIAAVRNPRSDAPPKKDATPVTLGGKTPPDNTKHKKDGLDAIIQLRATYKVAFDEYVKEFDKKKADIAILLAERKLSVADASAATTKAAATERDEQQALIALYLKKAEAAKAPTFSKEAFTGALKAQSVKIDDANQKDAAAQQLKAIADSHKVQDKGIADILTATRKAAAETIAITAAKVKAGTELASKGAEDDKAVLVAEHEQVMYYLNIQLQAAGQNADLQRAAKTAMTAADVAYTAAITKNATERTKAILTESAAALREGIKEATAKYDILVAATVSSQRVTETQVEIRQSAVMLAKAYADVAQETVAAAEAQLFLAKAGGTTGTELKSLITQLNAAKAALAKANERTSAASKSVVGTDPIVAAMSDVATTLATTFDGFGADSKELGANLATFAMNFSNVVTAGTAVMTAVVKDMTSVEAAIVKGGAQGVAAGLGAFGSVGSAMGGMSDGLLKESTKLGAKGSEGMSKLLGSMSSVFKDAGVIGSVASAAAGLISGITALFTAAAAEVAASIKKQMSATMTAYTNSGDTTLGATIKELQAEEASAIAQLSGMKGGQAQLDQLLPQLDAQIAQLSLQQKSIVTNFDTALLKLQLQSTVLSQTLDTWNAMNLAVKTYIDAGGDAAKAAAYISATLQAMKLDAANNLSAGDAKAVTQAIAYNNLLIQRQQLTDAYNKSKFDTLNADALERRASNGVTVGMNQKKADSAYQTSLTDLNTQISQAATEVSMYQQIYQISSDTATLKAQSSALAIQDLATQLKSLKDYQKVYNSIYQNPNGSYGTNNAAGTGPVSPANTVNSIGAINIVINGPADSTSIANTIQGELQRSGRYGTGSTFTTN